MYHRLRAVEMCKGIEEETHLSGLRRIASTLKGVSGDKSAISISCELCRRRASLYCMADDAFLCWKCDRRVHGANFLAFRHTRRLLCGTCQNFTKRYVTGSSYRLVITIMRKRSRWCNSKINQKSSRFTKRETKLYV
ncbi:hypothetical protein Scep_028709 [Stephania cephalantha]|uniref:B box-type domain-containing protein n=1 Tax=Stephania cephalantha TaxID=152367 RepID=A0AAP0EF21_9MAGN